MVHMRPSRKLLSRWRETSYQISAVSNQPNNRAACGRPDFICIHEAVMRAGRDHQNHHAVGSIVSHPRKQREDGAPCLEIAQGWATGLSNAHAICDFGGGFAEYSSSAGLGPSGSTSMFTGFNSDNTPVVGGSVTVGGGVGVDATVGSTYTDVTPLFGRKTTCQ
jgi:hypothetical protein